MIFNTYGLMHIAYTFLLTLQVFVYAYFYLYINFM